MALIRLFLLICSLFLAPPVWGQNLPAYSNYVNDYADLLPADVESALNQKLADFTTKTGNQLAVAIVNSLNGLTVEDYAVRLFENWGIGQKNKDNGLLLLVSKDDRKVKIEVGYGLEGTLPDGLVGRLLDTEFVPEFKKGNYQAGITNTVDKLISYLSDPSAIPTDIPPVSPSSKNILGAILFFLFTGLPIYFLSYLSRSKEIYTGAIVGAILGFILGQVLGAIGFGLFGLLLDYFLSRNYQRAQKSGRSSNFWTSFGGFKTSGGSHSGGGFGGFGGGHSGGGGASRGW